MTIRTREHLLRGETAITLEAGELSATFLPDVGMTGVSLRWRSREYLAVPGGVTALRAGATAGLPLLAPWANRLASRRYRAAGVTVDLEGLPLGVDGNGLPIHGLLVGAPGWRVDRADTRRGAARLQASIDVDAPAFPFPHRIEVVVTARDGELGVATSVIPTGRRRCRWPSAGIPYLRLPGVPRASGGCACRRAGTSPSTRSASRPAPKWPSRPKRRPSTGGRSTICTRSAVTVGCRSRLDDGPSIELRSDAAYPYAQVWVPAGRRFAALEPMVAPTNALADRGRPPRRAG